MWTGLIDEYWNKFQDYQIKISLPNGTNYVVKFYDMYLQLSEKFNDDNAYLNLPRDETPKGIFCRFIDNILIKIIDERYVLQYMIMRVVTYNLYNYYENHIYGNPAVDCYDKNNKIILSIPRNMWRWWVEEMNY